MLVATCGLIYLALAHLPRQRYILQSMFEEEARRLLLERSSLLEAQISAAENGAIAALIPTERRSFVVTAEKDKWVKTAFLLDANFNVVVPTMLTSYAKWKGEEADISQENGAGQLFLEGEKYEFALAQYEEAVKFYRLAAEQFIDPGLESKARLALAGSLCKLKKYQEAALEAQKSVLNAQKQSVSPYLELVGWYWYAQALDSMGDAKAWGIRLNLYERLLKREFSLPRKSQYLFWEAKICETLHQKKLSEEEAQTLSALQLRSRLPLAAEELCDFLQGQGIGRIKETMMGTPGTPDTLRHLYGESSGKVSWIAYAAFFREGRLHGIRGFSIDMDYCREFLAQLLRTTGNFTLAVRTPSENLFKDKAIPEQAPLASLSLKVWEGFSLAVYPKTSRELEKAIWREKVFTMALTALTAAILLAGLYFTWKSFTREVELSKLKSDFVACISHELRTPLAIIQSFGETLSLGRVGEEKKIHYYETIVHEAERLTRLITNILNISQIEAGKFQLMLEPVALRPLLEKLVDGKSVYWPDYHGAISLETAALPSQVLLDSTAIRSAVFNLLDNAVKYSPEQQNIVVGCQGKDKKILLWVEDHGKGIAPEEQQKIFHKFYRGRSAKGTRGIGLGLKMVYYIVTAHGGGIHLTSALGKGTRVELWIPLER